MVKVGGEVDSFCGKCELTLAHTVHAVVGTDPVKVECNTCHAVHRYRAPQGSSGDSAGTSAAQRKAGRPARPRKVELGFDELLAQHPKAPVPYSAKRAFAPHDVVDHPTFGRGFVTEVRGDKVEITFRSDVKVLVHGRG